MLRLSTDTIEFDWIFFFVLLHYQVEESLNEMDFQLLLELHFTDGDYT